MPRRRITRMAGRGALYGPRTVPPFRYRHPPRIRIARRTPFTGAARRMFWSRSRQHRMFQAAIEGLKWQPKVSPVTLPDGAA